MLIYKDNTYKLVRHQGASLNVVHLVCDYENNISIIQYVVWNDVFSLHRCTVIMTQAVYEQTNFLLKAIKLVH